MCSLAPRINTDNWEHDSGSKNETIIRIKQESYFYKSETVIAFACLGLFVQCFENYTSNTKTITIQSLEYRPIFIGSHENKIS